MLMLRGKDVDCVVSWLTCHASEKCLHYNIWRTGNHPIFQWIVLMRAPLSSDESAYDDSRRQLCLAETFFPHC